MVVNSDPARFCVCYMANEGYLFQSLVSAVQARNFSPHDCDVIIYDLTRVRGDESHRIQHVCKMKNIIYKWESPNFLGGLHIMNARLFLDQLLPEHYTEILYMDGDTQVVADLTPLLSFEPQDGGLCAVRDPMIYLSSINQLSDRFENEIRPFGDDYINSGVFRVSRSSWASISREALAQMGASSNALYFEDQTIINRVTAGRRDYASIRWNFPGFVLGYGIEKIAQPSIVHFMSNPRPWQGAYAPWGRSWNEPYLAIASDFPEIAEYCNTLDLRRRAAYKVKQLAKSYIERRVWNKASLMDHVKRLEEKAVV